VVSMTDPYGHILGSLVTKVTMKNVFRDGAQCGFIINRRFGVTCRTIFRAEDITRARKSVRRFFPRSRHPLHPEDGGDTSYKTGHILNKLCLNPFLTQI
jgi:hypothetical protein